MEIRELTVADVPSLLELYTQLDKNNRKLPVDTSVELWKEEIDEQLKELGTCLTHRTSDIRKVILVHQICAQMLEQFRNHSSLKICYYCISKQLHQFLPHSRLNLILPALFSVLSHGMARFAILVMAVLID